MDSVEERVASLEGRLLEHSMRIDDVREALASLETRMDRRFEQLEQRMDQRFAAVDLRFGSIDHRFLGMDQRFTGIDGRLDRLETLSWSLLVAVITGVISLMAVMLSR